MPQRCSEMAMLGALKPFSLFAHIYIYSHIYICIHMTIYKSLAIPLAISNISPISRYLSCFSNLDRWLKSSRPWELQPKWGNASLKFDLCLASASLHVVMPLDASGGIRNSICRVMTEGDWSLAPPFDIGSVWCGSGSIVSSIPTEISKMIETGLVYTSFEKGSALWCQLPVTCL